MTIKITGGTVVNEGQIKAVDILIENQRITKIETDLSGFKADKTINASGLHILPGLIDDQVHFREPGLTHKATIASESIAAVAGGTTTFFEMPNTVPNALTRELLEQKYAIAAQSSLANYSFYMGASNDNFDEVMQTNPEDVCGIKIFMGSSTGNMLVDNRQTLENLFKNCPMLIATHCEDEATVRQRLAEAKQKYTGELPTDIHAIIRNETACYLSSSMAIELAEKHHTRLHILHISTADELALFRNKKSKKITAEVCVHHLYYDAEDYKQLGNFIKCNPAIKAPHHKDALFAALLDDTLDVIATDHAPHTLEEKLQDYWSAPSGLPLVQHSLQVMLDFHKKGAISLEKIVQKTSHAVADCFKIKDRGYIREGFYADLVLVDLNLNETVEKTNLYAKCGWSPFEGKTFSSSIRHTLVSGSHVFENGTIKNESYGMRVKFNL